MSILVHEPGASYHVIVRLAEPFVSLSMLPAVCLYKARNLHVLLPRFHFEGFYLQSNGTEFGAKEYLFY